ncbi:hypothetical protein [Nocardia nepalensis]|uniref:hypothetical protein n=1 Tax=Nocardia nepalensis TaxID=3375448 RepID=UPI003B67BE63
MRRAIVTAPNLFSLNDFYRHIAHRLGQPKTFADALGYHGDPLRLWIDVHRELNQSTYGPVT